ncbi:unnamed protein product [Malus baccata var. baccata]
MRRRKGERELTLSNHVSGISLLSLSRISSEKKLPKGEENMVLSFGQFGSAMGVVLKCIFSSLPSTRPFGSSLASGSVGTPKLSEKEVRALPGWVTHREVAREFPKTKP